jgi:hypothetical protein
MNQSRTLTVVSLVAVLLFTLHFSDDIVRGMEKGDLTNYVGVLLAAFWLATILVVRRRGALVIMLLFSLAAGLLPLVHMRGEGLVGGGIAASSGAFCWVWTQIALGVTGLVAAFLSARALWATPVRST